MPPWLATAANDVGSKVPFCGPPPEPSRRSLQPYIRSTRSMVGRSAFRFCSNLGLDSPADANSWVAIQ